MAEAIRFIRESGSTIIRPELLGLAAMPPLSEPDAAAEGLYKALLAGDRQAVTGLIISAYASGQSIPLIFDGPMRTAMHRVGELWQHDQKGILVEHRATEICLQAISQLRGMPAAAEASAPLALGGAAADDPYLLPSMMAAAVLADVGYRDMNFGAQTPLDLLASAADEHGAALVWLSISSIARKAALHGQIAALHEQLEAKHIALVVGGRMVTELSLHQLVRLHVVQSMAELAAFAQGALVNAAVSRTTTSKTSPSNTPRSPRGRAQ